MRCCCGLAGKHNKCCSLFFFLSGLLMLASGFWMTVLYRRFTPVYHDIKCAFGSAALEGLHVGMPGFTPTTFDTRIEMKCSNPNPYSIRFAYSNEGGVFVGSGRTKVGESMETPYSDSRLPAYETGSVWTSSSVEISAAIMVNVFPQLMSNSGVPLYIMIDQLMEVDIHFWFGNWTVRVPVNKSCGMMVAGVSGLLGSLRSHSAVLGPMACADSFEDLQSLPPLNQGAPGGTVVFADYGIGKEDVAKGELAKNIGLGVAMAVTFSLALVCLSCSLHWRCCHHHHGRSKVDTKAYHNANDSGSDASTASSLSDF